MEVMVAAQSRLILRDIESYYYNRILHWAGHVRRSTYLVTRMSMSMSWAPLQSPVW